MARTSRQSHAQTPILVIIGPSGSGKSTLLQALVKKNLVHLTPSWTTRPPRPSEVGVVSEHVFVDEQAFQKKAESGYFVETVQLFGLPFQYGLPYLDIPKPPCIPVVMLRVPVLSLFEKYYHNVIIYQVEADFQTVEERLRLREHTGEPIGTRLKDYQLERDVGRKKSQRVFTNDGTMKQLVAEVVAALVEDFSK